MRWIVVMGLVLFVAATAPASADNPYEAGISPSGHIITKKTLAECKRQARVRKLSYIRQRQFIRKCVGI